MNSQKIDGKEKASKRFKVFNHLVHAVKSTVSLTFMLMVARHFLFIFFLSSVNSISKLDWLFQSFKCKDFLVMSIFSLKFASALGIARQCLVNGMIDKCIYIFFWKWPPNKSVPADIFGWFMAVSVEINSLFA